VTQLTDALEAVDTAEPGAPKLRALGTLTLVLQHYIKEAGHKMKPDVLAAFHRQIEIAEEDIVAEMERLDPALRDTLVRSAHGENEELAALFLSQHGNAQ